MKELVVSFNQTFIWGLKIYYRSTIKRHVFCFNDELSVTSKSIIFFDTGVETSKSDLTSNVPSKII